VGRGPPDRRATEDNDDDDDKVRVPDVKARMKERHDGGGLGIDGRQIGAFEAIAVRTREREIGQVIVAPVLAGADMFDVEPHGWDVCLGQLAIFTAVPSGAWQKYSYR
jgi:hypothetical protein